MRHGRLLRCYARAVRHASSLSLLVCLSCADRDAVLDRGIVLNAMSDAEAKRVCEYRGHRYRRAKGSVRENCMTFAVRQNSPAECEAELTTCARSDGASSQQASGAFAQQRPQLERAMLDCSDASAASWGDCDATFGEYSDCFDALTHAHVQYRESLSCEQAPLDSYGPYFTVPTAPSPELRLEACEAFYARCLPED